MGLAVMDHQKQVVLIKTAGGEDSFWILFVCGFSAGPYVSTVPYVGGAVSLQVVRRAPGREGPLFCHLLFLLEFFWGTELIS